MSAFVVGGCVYRSMVHVDHLGSVLSLAACSTPDLHLAGIDYEHTSNLPAGRAAWLRRQIDNRELDYAISIDSDSQFSASQLFERLVEIDSVESDLAIGIVPFRIGGGGGLINVHRKGSTRYSVRQMAREFATDTSVRVWLGGFGVAVFDLAWFRHSWSKPTAERVSLDSEYGEDVEMCMAVYRRGGSVYALKVDSSHHDLIGGDRAELTW